MYTNVSQVGNFIYCRKVENSVRTLEKVEFKPTLFCSTNKVTKYKNIAENYVEAVYPGNIKDCREFIDQYSSVNNFTLYGNTNWIYQFISDEYKEEIKYDMNDISVAFIDIETECENGWPDIDDPQERVNVITFRIKNTKWVFALGEYSTQEENVNVFCCDTEDELFYKFLQVWKSDYPDVVTGWNIRFFDIPYLVHRIKKVLGNKYAKTLSPYEYLTHETIEYRGREHNVYKIQGISTLDYIELYRKYTTKPRDSYSLDNIAFVELGERKIDYPGTLKEFYTNDFKRFVDYNIKDVDLVYRLDEKLKMIELQVLISYSAKINFEDTFSQTRVWDNIIYNYLKERDIVIPFKEVKEKDTEFAGGYVKDPIPDMYNWIVTYDLASLYPSIIIACNCSPDTIIDDTSILGQSVDVEKLLNHSIDTSSLESLDACLMANGQLFRKDKRGFLPDLMIKYFDRRKEYKKTSLEFKKKAESEKDEIKKEEYKKQAKMFDIYQLATKISINSAYGSLGTQYFRYYDVRQAEGITLTGQFIIRWIAKQLNEYLNKITKSKDLDFVLASDTDSVMIDMHKIVDARFTGGVEDKDKAVNFLDKFSKDVIEPFLKTKFAELAKYLNCYENRFDMKRDCIADRGFWSAKKRYALNVYDSEGVRYEKPELKIMGIEVQRTSTPQACRNKLKECINIILTKDQETLIRCVEEFKKQFYALEPEEISSPRGVNGIEEYYDKESIYKKGTPIAVKGALLYNDLIKKKGLGHLYQNISDGDKIKYIYLKMPNPVKDKVISFSKKLPPELGLKKYVDYDLQFEKSFMDPLNIIVGAIKWNIEQDNGLDEFFG